MKTKKPKQILKRSKGSKPFNFKKALKGRPFTWNEQPEEVLESGREFDIIRLVGESRSDSYPEGCYVAQLQSLDEGTEDSFIVAPIEVFELNCRMLTKLELALESGMIPTSTTIN